MEQLVAKFGEISSTAEKYYDESSKAMDKCTTLMCWLVAAIVVILVIAYIISNIIDERAVYLVGAALAVVISVSLIPVYAYGSKDSNSIIDKGEKAVSEVRAETAELVVENQDSIEIVKDGYIYEILINGEKYSLDLRDEAKVIKYNSDDKKWYLADKE